MRERTHLRVRVGADLLARLEKARRRSGHTLTGEIVKRLEDSFQWDDEAKLVEATAKAVVDRLLAVAKVGRALDA